MPEVLPRDRRYEAARSGRHGIATVAGFTSESWPTSNRNGGRLRVGIRSRAPPGSVAYFYTAALAWNCSAVDIPSTALGRVMLQIGALFAEMERNLIRERTKAGLSAARARGRLGGRKPKMDAAMLDTAKRLMADPYLTMSEIAGRLGIDRATLYRSIDRKAELMKPKDA